MVYKLGNSDETAKDEYSANVTQRNASLKAQIKGPGLKIGKCITLSNRLENEILNNKKSPYAALQDLSKSKKEFKVSICEKTLYNYIYFVLFVKLISKDLTYKMTRGKKLKDKKKLFNGLTSIDLENVYISA